MKVFHLLIILISLSESRVSSTLKRKELFGGTFVDIENKVYVPNSTDFDVNRIRLSTSNVMVLAAGQGTTGTHSIYHELCEMGIKTVHYRTGCKGVSVKMGLDLKRTDENLENLLERIKDGKVEALIDSPVSYIFNELYLSSPNAKVILSVRDPKVWVEKRLLDHPHALICRESVFLPEMHSILRLSKNVTISDSKMFSSFKNNDPFVSDIDEYFYPPLPHGFALRICMQRAALRNEHSSRLDNEVVPVSSAMVTISDYVTMIKKLKHDQEDGKQIALDILSKAYHEYNEYIKSVVPAERLLVVDLWKQDACEFHDRIQTFLNRTLDPKFRGSIVGIKIGKELGEKTSCDCASCSD